MTEKKAEETMEEMMQKTQQGRTWAGEALWTGQPATGRTVHVTLDGESFKALGKAGRQQAFVVWGRLGQLRRFQRQMERDGAQVKGLPVNAPAGEAPRHSHDHGPIEESPPNHPQQPPATRPGTAGDRKTSRRGQRQGQSPGGRGRSHSGRRVARGRRSVT